MTHHSTGSRPRRPFIPFIAIAAFGWLPATARAAGPEDALPYERWTVSDTVLSAGAPGAFDDVAVKDPAIVFHNGRYHVFYTSKVSRETAASLKFVDRQRSGLGYVAAPTLAGLSAAPRQNLNVGFGAIVIAPQVFLFEPQKLWYLVAQVPAPGERPDLRPVYSTNRDLDDPRGWSPLRPIPTRKQNNDFWIDFWVICDDAKAHLFYTDHRGSLFRMETPLDRFPDFSRSIDETVLTERGRTKRGPWRLHEASHIYYVRSAKKYLCLLEAVYPHPTRRNYWDSRSRFMFAMVADRLEGPWQRAERTPGEFAGDPARLFRPDGARAHYDQVSHFEIVRPGVNQRFEIPDFHFVLLFQGFDAKGTPDSYVYDDLPWELALMKNFPGDWRERLPDPAGRVPSP